MTELASQHEMSEPPVVDDEPGMRTGVAGRRPTLGSASAALEIDTRLFGMLGALAVLWIGFHFFSDGLFLTPRNLWNLSVQSAAVAVLATGMVLVIVARHIDLSVGSMVVFVAMFMGILQAEWLPNTFGWGLGRPYTWIVVLAAGVALGAAVGAVHGVVVAYVGVPSFIVTLGGLLIWRALAFELADGRTIAPLDSRFQLIGGGPNGSLGEMRSWLVALVGSVAIIAGLVAGRLRRRRYGFPPRAVWADIALGALGCGAVIGAVWIANSYMWPPALAAQHAANRGIAEPPGGLRIPTGIAYPVLIAVGVTIVMSYLARRRRFGRYVYSIGGNPEAAELAGINTRWTVMKTFIVMGILAALAAGLISARLNAATIGLGTGIELQVIAAAVIGGTSLAGGVGTIPGAVLGAVLMQSLQSGMVLMKVGTVIQDVVIGLVLVGAVAFDTILARRRR